MLNKIKQKIYQFKKWLVALIFGGVVLAAPVVPIDLPQIDLDRTLNSQIIQNDNGSFTLNAHVGHINYLDKNTGKLEKINTDVLKTPTGWEMKKAGYEVKLPEKNTGLVQFYSNSFDFATSSLYEISQGEIPQLFTDISFKKQSLVEIAIGKEKELSQFVGQDNINFALSKINGVPVKEVQGVKTDHNQITYSEVAPDIDFQLSCGYNSFRKEIVIKKKPVFTGDFFEIEFNTNSSFNKKTKARFQEKDIHFRNARVWSEKGEGADIEIEFSAGKMIKRIPREFLEKAEYPIRTDTTTSYYSGAGDGGVGEYPGTTWSTIHDAASANAPNYTKTYISHNDYSDGVFTGRWSSSYYIISRGFVPIDTSALDDSAIISASTLNLYKEGAVNAESDAQAYISVVKTFQANYTQVVAGDFEDCGYGDSGDAGGHASDANIVKGSNDITLSSIVSGSGYIAFTLNATGRGWISKTGYTPLGFREGHDIEDSPLGTNVVNSFKASSSEQTDTSQDPYLSVTYTAGSRRIIMPQ